MWREEREVNNNNSRVLLLNLFKYQQRQEHIETRNVLLILEKEPFMAEVGSIYSSKIMLCARAKHFY